MASVLHFEKQIWTIENDIGEREESKNTNGRKEFLAARLLQAIWRGHMIRIRVIFWHEQITIVQKHFRGYLGRKIYRERLKEAYLDLCWNWYNKMAARIESLYRGYYSRKNLFDYYAMKRWIESVKQKNYELKVAVKEEQAIIDQEILDQIEEEAHKWVLFIAFKLHHLLRTRAIAGIYSLNYTIELSKFEKLLKSVKYTEYIKILHEKYRKHMECMKETKPQRLFTCHRRCKEEEAIFYQRNRDSETETFSKKPIPLACKKNFKFKPDFKLYGSPAEPIYEPYMFKKDPYEPICTDIIREVHPEMFLGGDFDLSSRTINKEMLDYIEYHINELQNQKCQVHYSKIFEDNRCLKPIKDDC